MTKQKKGSSSNERSLSEMQKVVRKPHAASHLPALYPYSSSLCRNNKAGQAVWVWGRTEQQELLWGWTWRPPDFICSLSMLSCGSFFSRPILLHYVWRNAQDKTSIGFMEGASKSHLTLHTSRTYPSLPALLHKASRCQHLQQNSFDFTAAHDFIPLQLL